MEGAEDGTIRPASVAGTRVAALYPRLKAIARRFARALRRDDTLQPTALLHEAFLRIARGSRSAWNGTTHFRRTAVAAMRSVIVDRARSRSRLKRGTGHAREELIDEVPRRDDGAASRGEDVRSAIGRLAGIDPRAARVVELRYFDGLTESEIAARLGVSRRTVQAEWVHARAWLLRALEGDESGR